MRQEPSSRWEKADASGPSRILVVDDLPENLELVEAYLGGLGHRVAKASNGPDALRKVKEETPDLILLDVTMPGMDGYEVCRRLKADADSAPIPVLILTALSAHEEMVRASEAGADDLLGKPFSGLELLMRVRCLLRIKKLHDQVEEYRRMAAVGRMAGGIAHEMRNPLAITFSAAQILLRKGTNPALRQECAEKIHTAARRTAGIVEDFLRLTRPCDGLSERAGVGGGVPLTAYAAAHADGLQAVGTQA